MQTKQTLFSLFLMTQLIRWQKKYFFIFLLIYVQILFSGCSQNPPAVSKEQTLDQTIASLLDDKTSCLIPKSAQIIHLPQVHKYPESLRKDLPGEVLNFFHDTASHSQFLIAHLISQTPSPPIIFNEGSRHIITADDKNNFAYAMLNENGDEQPLSFQSVADTFNHRLPSSYQDLSSEQKNILLEVGAAAVSLSLDHIQAIHRTHNPSEAKLLEQIFTKIWSYQDELESELRDLTEQALKANETNNKKEFTKLTKEAQKLSQRSMTLEKRSDRLMLDTREEILAREVHFFLENNPSVERVFIIYGAAHDLSDEFSEDLFYTIPHHCTIPKSFLKSSTYAYYLKNRAEQIFNDNDRLFSDHVESIIILYQKSYDILINIIKEHIQKGGNLKDPSLSWSQRFNRYFTYSELRMIAEGVYMKKTNWENILKENQ